MKQTIKLLILSFYAIIHYVGHALSVESLPPTEKISNQSTLINNKKQFSPNYRFHPLPFAESLSHPSIKDIIQDEFGYTWIATVDGLNRYDGYSNKIFRPTSSKNSISHALITKLFIDHRNQLWIGTQNGLNQFKSDRSSFKRFRLTPPEKSAFNSTTENISMIFEDSQRQLWIGTRDGMVFRISADRQHIDTIKTAHLPFKSLYIHNFFETKENQVLMTTNRGVFAIDDTLKASEHLPLSSLNTSQTFTINNNTTIIKQHTNHSLLIGTSLGLYSFDLNTNIQHALFPNSLQKSMITTILPLSQEQYLIGTRSDGISLIDLKNQTIKSFLNSAINKYSLIDNQILSFYKDKNNLIWIATNLGINLLDTEQLNFGHLKADSSQIECMAGNTIYSTLLDSKRNLFIAAFGAGLTTINVDSQLCQSVTFIENEQNLLAKTIDLTEDSRGIIWVATFDNGLFTYDRNTKAVQPFELTPKIKSTRISINAIHHDNKDHLWVATYGNGLFKVDALTKEISRFQLLENEQSKNPIKHINDLTVDSHDNLWIATQLKGLWQFNTNTMVAQPLQNITKSQTKLPTYISSTFIDSSKRLWISSNGSGLFLYDPRKDSIKTISIDEGLHSNAVLRTIEDKDHNIWALTDKGLSKLSNNGHVLYTFFDNDGVQSNTFTNTGFYDALDDTIWVGGIHGLTHFSPSIVEPRSTINKVTITDFELHYQSVLPTQHSNSLTTPEQPLTLEQPIESTSTLSLAYHQNVFAFTFSSFEFLKPKRVKFRFMLEGYDEQWREVNFDRRYANYTNIPPGNYRFKVKASSPFGKWTSQETTIGIHIATPWWQTSFAFFMYFVTLITAIYLWFIWRTKQLRKYAKTLEKNVQDRTFELNLEKEKVEKLLEDKYEELGTVSHEFKTPLSLILGPVAQMLSSNPTQEQFHKLSGIQQNGYRLLRMVDQLLNLESFRVQTITQKATIQTDKVVQLITQAFQDLAKENNITIHLLSVEKIHCELTPDSLEKILLNLISNSIKYSNSGSTIKVSSIRSATNQLQISVEDTGMGIEKEQLESIFKRFHRLKHNNQHNISGTGIGLALVKQLVDAHNGKIEIESELNVGTKITLSLPIINETFELNSEFNYNEEITNLELFSFQQGKKASKISETTRSETTKNETTNTKNSDTNNEKPSLLIIEDNIEMQEFIASCVNADYQILTANDGEQGVHVAIEEVPDLIICDIMMPHKDGYQVTKELRENHITSHIPIVLLTARGDKKSRLKGWQQQADEYLTKPFDHDELKIRLKNIIQIRNILKVRFSEIAFSQSNRSDGSTGLIQDQSTTDKGAQVTDTQVEQVDSFTKSQNEFIQKLNQLLENYYKDPALNVSSMASSIAMSERQFFRKIKNTLNMTPAEYLRRYRLNQAKQLLLSGKSASFSAFEVGFSSQSYFGKCFKAQYGVSPIDFKKQAIGTNG